MSVLSMATVVIRVTPSKSNPENVRSTIGVFGFGLANEIATEIAKGMDQAMKQAAADFEAAQQTAVPETERCGENAEPASGPIG